MLKSNVILRFLVILLALLVVAPIIASAATIHGDVYSVTLDKEINVLLQINTIPEQVYISKDGSYTFNVPIGDYNITATSKIGFARESIYVVDNSGDYNIDIVLEPTIYNPSDKLLVNENVSNISSGASLYLSSRNRAYDFPWLWASLTLILILIIATLVYLKLRESKHKKRSVINALVSDSESKGLLGKTTEHDGLRNDNLTDEYGTNVLQIIKKEKRVTQKDLRKQIPLSEGKISLIITQLEHDGKIRKIKKGRGNILIFIKE